MSAIDEALDAIRRRDAVRAEECALRAVGEAPREARARAAVALALVLARRGREALAEADRAVAAAPGGAWALLVRSAALRQAGRGREAVASAEEAVRLAPGSHHAQLGLALSLFVAGYGDRARAPLERARASRPEDPLALRLLGEIELRGDPAAAEASFRSALRADARDADARGGLSRALARQGRVKEAEEAFEAAAARDPSLAADRDARRVDMVAFLQATVAAFVVVLCFQLAQGVIAARWPAARGAATTLSFIASGAVPAVLISWAMLRLRRARMGGPPDPQVPSLADAVQEATSPARPPE
ncbi:MAG TPA: tetratricopeptide repeat protein [Anaeromyxobacteraceae bacterium]|nr:tetratricopeptide repeat protein [Anaeromyxobacteraceae bacterium]